MGEGISVPKSHTDRQIKHNDLVKGKKGVSCLPSGSVSLSFLHFSSFLASLSFALTSVQHNSIHFISISGT